MNILEYVKMCTRAVYYYFLNTNKGREFHDKT